MKKNKIKEAINQLDSLKFHCEKMIQNGGSEEWEKDVKALDVALTNLKDELQITKEIILTRKIKAKESLQNLQKIYWWDEDTKKQCKKVVKNAVMNNLINQLLEQDLVKINYKNQDNLIIGEAEIEVLERKPN